MDTGPDCQVCSAQSPVLMTHHVHQPGPSQMLPSQFMHDGWFVHMFVQCIMTMTLVCMSFCNPSDQAREKATGGLMSMQVVRLGFSWLQMNILVVSCSFRIIPALHERDEECVFESSRVRIIPSRQASERVSGKRGRWWSVGNAKN